MFLHEIVRALERLEERQREILEQMKALTAAGAGEVSGPEGDGEDPARAVRRKGDWIQSGIDNILAYEAGRKKEE